MTPNRRALLLICLCAAPVFAGDEQAEAIEAFRVAAQDCKTAPSQEIGFEVKGIPGKPVTEPATPDELARVKNLLAESGMPYDPVNHRTTYELTLAMVRMKRVAMFKVVADAESTASVRECLAKLASEAGLEARFE
jgi:hypothetical protein